MNLSIHPLVVRARIRAALPQTTEIAFQFYSHQITVFVADQSMDHLIPTVIEGMSVKIVYYKKAM